MAMQTDILASAPLTSSGQMLTQSGGNILRSRIKAILIIPGATAGSVVFKDGGASGTTIATFNTVALATQPMYMLLPGEGLLFRTDMYAAISNIGSVTVFYA